MLLRALICVVCTQDGKDTPIIKQTKLISSEFELGKVLGSGHLGVTRLATSKKDGQQYACKTIEKEKLLTPEDVESVRQEIQIMHLLSGHEHIVQIVDYYEEKTCVHILMELCTGGELLQFIMEKVSVYFVVKATNVDPTLASWSDH